MDSGRFSDLFGFPLEVDLRTGQLVANAPELFGQLGLLDSLDFSPSLQPVQQLLLSGGGFSQTREQRLNLVSHVLAAGLQDRTALVLLEEDVLLKQPELVFGRA